MVKKPQKEEQEYPVYHTSKPNYSAIYDKLSQLKLLQQARRQPTYNYRIIPQYEPQQEYTRSQLGSSSLILKPQSAQQGKTVIQTYSPTDIEITTTGNDQYETPEYQPAPRPNEREELLKAFLKISSVRPTARPVLDPNGELIKTYLKASNLHQTPTPIIEYGGDVVKNYVKPNKPYQPVYFISKLPQQLVNQDHVRPITLEEQLQYENDHKQYVDQKTESKRPISVDEVYNIKGDFIDHNSQVQKPLIVLQEKPLEIQQPERVIPETHTVYPLITTTDAIKKPYSENPNSLGVILKKLQASNELPHELTPDNIDNSIKTLVRILSALKKQQKFTKPIVVADENGDYEEESLENEAEVTKRPEQLPGTVVQTFPAITEEGGTPGKPGIDYPALSTIPQTRFNCKTQRYKGFFGDPDTNCQVSIEKYNINNYR